MSGISCSLAGSVSKGFAFKNHVFDCAFRVRRAYAKFTCFVLSCPKPAGIANAKHEIVSLDNNRGGWVSGAISHPVISHPVIISGGGLGGNKSSGNKSPRQFFQNI